MFGGLTNWFFGDGTSYSEMSSTEKINFKFIGWLGIAIAINFLMDSKGR